MLRNSRFVLVMVAILALLAAPVVAQEARDPNPPGPPFDGTAPEATGGPDAFGYTWADQADGCTYDFIDITATGTFLFSGDFVGAAVTLGAPFNFYGVDYTDIAMTSKGYMSTDLTDISGADTSPDCPLPATPSSPPGTNGARFYVLHDDTLGDGYYEYFDQCPRVNPRCGQIAEPCSVFQWDDVTHFSGGGPWTQEAVLYHLTGDMVFMIGPGNPETGAGSTTGIQDPAPPTTGLTYACATPGSVPDNTAVCWTHPDAPPGICLSVLAVPTASPTGLVMLTLLILMSGVAMLIVLRKRHAS